MPDLILDILRFNTYEKPVTVETFYGYFTIKGYAVHREYYNARGNTSYLITVEYKGEAHIASEEETKHAIDIGLNAYAGAQFIAPYVTETPPPVLSHPLIGAGILVYNTAKLFDIPKNDFTYSTELIYSFDLKEH